jgi:hypothetical protein
MVDLKKKARLFSLAFFWILSLELALSDNQSVHGAGSSADVFRTNI